MKHEQCKNCTQSKFAERSTRAPGILGFLFGVHRTGEHIEIHCVETYRDIDFDDYHLICVIGCGSFKDNNIKKE